MGYNRSVEDSGTDRLLELCDHKRALGDAGIRDDHAGGAMQVPLGEPLDANSVAQVAHRTGVDFQVDRLPHRRLSLKYHDTSFSNTL